MGTTEATHMNMKKRAGWMWPTIAFGLALGVLPIGPTSADAKTLELWVPPAEKAAEKRVGDWAVAKLKSKRETHFVFGLPDNMDVDVPPKAVVVLIPPKNGELHYKVTYAAALTNQHY